MSVPLRLAAFAVVLALAFGGAVLAGSAINPTDGEIAAADAAHGGGEQATGGEAHADAPATTGSAAEDHAEEGHSEEPAATASGLAVSQDGYSLDVERTHLTAGAATPFRFRVMDEGGRVVRDGFELEHDRRLHLIVVRRDTATFQHLHPRKDGEGTWSLDLRLPDAGVYRLYADFKIDGKQRTLATDLFVAGRFRPERLPAPEPIDRTGELDVELAAPGLRAGREVELTFAVTRDGRPFEQLQPYLGAKGHLVALREGDLAYLHVHPTEGGEAHEHADGSTSSETHANEVKFAATFPTAGSYRLFLQFTTGGEVRTVAYTVEVPR